MEPTQPPIECVPKALSLGLKLPEREADNLHTTSTENKKKVELYIHLSPQTSSQHSA
jgi:hypothetical protein